MKRDDTLWKAILEDVFDDFLRFLYPNAEEIFDLERGFDFLDKELEDIMPQFDVENVRYVDKLVKVWLKDGSEEWILVHIEVQGKSENEFARRMFTYYYRIVDRYNRKVTAWAILADRNKKFLTNEFKETCLGTTLHYQFNLLKILSQAEDSLMKMDNPFAIVVLTVLLAIKKQKTSENELIELKMHLVKHLFQRNIPKQKIIALMNFLRHYVRFSKENTLIFEEKLDQFKGKSYPMGIEQFLLQRAENQGIAKGEKKGLEKGLEKVIRNAWENNFPLEAISKLVELPIEDVRLILKKLGLK